MGYGGTELPLFRKWNQNISCVILVTTLFFYCIVHTFIIVIPEKIKEIYHLQNNEKKILKSSSPIPLLDCTLKLQLTSKQVNVTCSSVWERWLPQNLSWKMVVGTINLNALLVNIYQNFWKIHMRMYLEAQGEEKWVVVENGLYIPKMVINEVEHVKVKGSCRVLGCL